MDVFFTGILVSLVITIVFYVLIYKLIIKSDITNQQSKMRLVTVELAELKNGLSKAINEYDDTENISFSKNIQPQKSDNTSNKELTRSINELKNKVQSIHEKVEKLKETDLFLKTQIEGYATKMNELTHINMEKDIERNVNVDTKLTANVNHEDNENKRIPEENPEVVFQENEPLNLKAILLSILQNQSIDPNFRNLLTTFYTKIFNQVDNRIVKFIEEILVDKFQIKVTHALKNANSNNYSQFIFVKFEERHNLTEIEKNKIRNITDVPEKSGLVLSVIYPQIEHNGQIISPGKILIS